MFFFPPRARLPLLRCFGSPPNISWSMQDTKEGRGNTPYWRKNRIGAGWLTINEMAGSALCAKQTSTSASCDYPVWTLEIGLLACFSPSISSRHIGGLASTAMTAASAAAKGLSSTRKYPALAILNDRDSLDSILSMLDIPQGFAHCKLHPAWGSV